ncbi:MAG TPA: hypothetical protein VGQ23_20530 [Burkholderiaceae bacterium]|jgi:hypothetical protein|nr:hypothetical protein [Burkholderiaceae bacterium]
MHSHDHGLAHDLQTIERRRALLWLAGAGAVSLLGCGGGDDKSTSSTSSTGSSSSGSTGSGSSGSTSSCAVIPEETAGPYPGDGSNQSSGQHVQRARAQRHRAQRHPHQRRPR